MRQEKDNTPGYGDPTADDAESNSHDHCHAEPDFGWRPSDAELAYNGRNECDD